VTRFGNDSRVLAFDLFNEADNPNTGSYGYDGNGRNNSFISALEATDLNPKDKATSSLILLKSVTAWARSVGPINAPITVPLWSGSSDAMREWILNHVDIISFHNYDLLHDLKAYISNLPLDRPLLCMEYMARPHNSMLNPILNYMKQNKIWAFNWGLVSGKSQTIYPWDSWQQEYTKEPTLWFHDLLYPDGRPYDNKEAFLLISLGTRDTFVE